MPIRSPRRIVSDTENRLMLLFSVNELGAVSATQLWTFAAELELMEYIPMRLCLHDLLESKELQMGENVLRDQIMPTVRGREALRLFGERLPSEVRERITAAAPSFRTRILRHRQVNAVYEMARANDYRLRLTVSESEVPTLVLRLETPRRSYADQAMARFEAKASEVLLYLYGLADRAMSVQELPTNAEPDAITVYSATETTAKLRLEAEALRITAELLLPSETVAKRFVSFANIPAEKHELTQKLCEMLCTATENGEKSR